MLLPPTCDTFMVLYVLLNHIAVDIEEVWSKNADPFVPTAVKNSYCSLLFPVQVSDDSMIFSITVMS